MGLKYKKKSKKEVLLCTSFYWIYVSYSYVLNF